MDKLRKLVRSKAVKRFESSWYMWYELIFLVCVCVCSVLYVLSLFTVLSGKPIKKTLHYNTRACVLLVSWDPKTDKERVLFSQIIEVYITGNASTVSQQKYREGLYYMSMSQSAALGLNIWYTILNGVCWITSCCTEQTSARCAASLYGLFADSWTFLLLLLGKSATWCGAI